MKKFKTVISVLAAASIVLTGCSLSHEQAKEATEFVNDEASVENTEDASSTDQSTVVVKNLFEPLLEELAGESETSTEAASAASTEDEPLPEDKVDIVVFGDSQMATGREDGTDIPTLIGDRVPNSRVFNLAIGGTTATLEKTTTEVTPETMQSTSFIGMTYCMAEIADRNATLANYPSVLEKMNTINPETIDYYIIEYGANDFFNEMPLDATIYDTETDQYHAYFNALSKGIDVLREISPNAYIIIASPFYGIYVDDNGGYIGDSYIVSNGIGTLADYAKKARNVSEEKDTFFFDGMFKTTCDLYVDTASQYLFDNLHLNETGRRIFGRLMAHVVNYKERNEPYAYLETDVIKIAEFDPYLDYRYDEGLMREYYPESWEKYIRGDFPLAQPSEEALELYGSEAATEASN